MEALELTRRGVLGTVAVLVVAGVCIRLGVWQLDRRAERLQRNQAVAERMADEPVTLSVAPTDTASLTYRRATVSGAVDNDRSIILAGRSRNGTPGVHILSPVRLTPGAVLVNRGWLPAPDAATVDLSAVRLVQPVRAEGVLVPFPDVDLGRGTDGFQTRWFRVDGDAIRRQYPYPVAPLYLVATAPVRPVTPTAGPTGTAGDTLSAGAPVPPGPPHLEPGPHLSYAIQWFSFAAIFLIGWIILLLRRPSRDAAPRRPGP